MLVSLITIATINLLVLIAAFTYAILPKLTRVLKLEIYLDALILASAVISFIISIILIISKL